MRTIAFMTSAAPATPTLSSAATNGDSPSTVELYGTMHTIRNTLST